LTLGPAKGGTRFARNVDIGEVAALAVWMSWKCALADLLYGGANGGITVDPAALSRAELENLSRRYMQEMIPLVGPRVDVMAPDMGTNEQVMAWFMDTYSMYQGITVSEIVTGKPVGSGGTLGRREATGHGVASLALRGVDALETQPLHATAIIQGFGNVGSHAVLGLASKGVKIVGLSDHTHSRDGHWGGARARREARSRSLPVNTRSPPLRTDFGPAGTAREKRRAELAGELRGRRLRCEARSPTKAELFFSPIFLFLPAPRSLHARFLAKRRPE
jgi:glutamate dehydrogenase/leucine dehydrogenase